MVGQWTCNLEVLGSWVAGGARGEGRRSCLMNWENTRAEKKNPEFISSEVSISVAVSDVSDVSDPGKNLTVFQ